MSGSNGGGLQGYPTTHIRSASEERRWRGRGGGYGSSRDSDADRAYNGLRWEEAAAVRSTRLLADEVQVTQGGLLATTFKAFQGKAHRLVDGSIGIARDIWAIYGGRGFSEN
jgi:hypothetical protein